MSIDFDLCMLLLSHVAKLAARAARFADRFEFQVSHTIGVDLRKSLVVHLASTQDLRRAVRRRPTSSCSLANWAATESTTSSVSVVVFLVVLPP